VTDPKTAGADLGAEIAARLAQSKTVRAFSPFGFDELWEAQRLYVERVAVDAIYAAKVDDCDSVSPKHVRRAVADFSSGRSGLGKALEPIGGVLAGAGASQALTVVFSEAARTTVSIVITLALITLGVAILAVGLARSWRR